jgi:hypothetical protein
MPSVKLVLNIVFAISFAKVACNPLFNYASANKEYNFV